MAGRCKTSEDTRISVQESNMRTEEQTLCEILGGKLWQNFRWVLGLRMKRWRKQLSFNLWSTTKRSQYFSLPTDYINLIKTSRRKNPYGVKYCDYTFFKNYKDISDLTSIKPTKKSRAPYVTDILQLKYTKIGEVHLNLTYKVQGKYTFTNRSAEQYRDAPIPISAAKYQHLQEICQQSLRGRHKTTDAMALFVCRVLMVWVSMFWNSIE